MEFIAFPACNDTIASHLFWIFLLCAFSAKGIHAFFTKFDLFDEEVRVYVVGVFVILLAGWCLFNTLYIHFRGISIGRDVVELHYLWPRASIVIDAASIDDVDIGTELQLYRPIRQWKHGLEIKTNQNKMYESVDVCMPKSVGPAYLTAIYTRVNDVVEQAEEAVALCAMQAKFASGRAASIPPDSYIRMFVKSLRSYSTIAADKESTPDKRQLAMQRLHEYLDMTKKAFGKDHYAVGLVYRFIGRTYGMRNDLKNAKAAFAEADKRDAYNAPWDKACDMMHRGGLDLHHFTDPDGPRTPNYVTQF